MLVQTFKKDPLFAGLFALLLLCAWLPLTQASILPFIDLQNNAGAASLLFDTASGGPMSKYYSVNWAPVPYWTGYIIMSAVSTVANTIVAVKFICGLLSLLLPLSVVRLLVALGRSPRQGLLAFLFVWDRNFYAGWVTFLLGMAIAIYTVALLLEVDSWRKALPVTVLSAIVALTHVQALAFLAVAGPTLVLTRQPTLRRLLLGGLALSGGLVGGLPWVLNSLFLRPAGGSRPPFSFVLHSPKQKMEALYDHVLGNFGGSFDTPIVAIAFLMLFLCPLLLTTTRRTMPQAPMRPPLIILTVFTVFYLVLPFTISGPVFHSYNYVRYATYIFLGMLFIPRPRLEGRSIGVLIPGIATALALDFHVAQQLRDTGKRSDQLLEIIANVPKYSTMLTVVTEMNDPAWQLPPYKQTHSYVTGMTTSFDPYYFDNASVPLLYRRQSRLPAPPQLSRIDYNAHVRYYSHVLVQGLAQDPFKTYLSNAPVKLVKEAGMWRLYAVPAQERTGP